MSKALGKGAAQGVLKDFFPDRESKGFRLTPPADFSFFNSLRLLEVDAFAGVVVALVESVLWDYEGRVVSSFSVSKDETYYSSTFEGTPPGAVICSRKKWLLVISHQLSEQSEKVEGALAAKGCLLSKVHLDSFFMFLRGKEMLNFKESMRLQADEAVAYQAAEPGYNGTAISDISPFYESIAAYEVDCNSNLVDRSIFWFSYLIACRWQGARSRYVNDSALSHMEVVYDCNLWHFPIDNARVALTAPHFKHTFVDIYRCIEWLYVLPRTVMVKAELKLAVKAIVLVKAFREKLSWRRNELDSLRLLIDVAGPENLDPKVLQACLLEPLPEKPPLEADLGKWRADAAEKVANRIYKLRNQFVHQLDADDMQEVVAGSEEQFITLLTQLCSILYKKYADEF